MISDEMLRAAASDAGAALLASLPGETPCAPPPRFERRMRRLIRRAEHPVLYPALRTAACFALAVLLGGSLLLTAVPEARAAFFGWVSRQLSNMIVYDFTDREFAETPDVLYRPTWLPEGYELTNSLASPEYSTYVYTNEEQKNMSFIGVSAETASHLYLFDDLNDLTPQDAMVNEIHADLYISQYEDVSSALVWEDPKTNMLFCITGQLDGETLLQIAESVVAQSP